MPFTKGLCSKTQHERYSLEAKKRRADGKLVDGTSFLEGARSKPERKSYAKTQSTLRNVRNTPSHKRKKELEEYEFDSSKYIVMDVKRKRPNE